MKQIKEDPGVRIQSELQGLFTYQEHLFFSLHLLQFPLHCVNNSLWQRGQRISPCSQTILHCGQICCCITITSMSGYITNAATIAPMIKANTQELSQIKPPSLLPRSLNITITVATQGTNRVMVTSDTKV